MGDNVTETEMTPALRDRLLSKVSEYADRESLRCLAFATLNSALSPEQYDLVDESRYAQYEVMEHSSQECIHPN